MILTTILIYFAYSTSAQWWIYVLIALELLCRKVHIINRREGDDI